MQELGIGFVVEIVRRVHPPRNIYDDVVAAGLLALEKAKKSYNPAKGTDFAPYAACAVFRAAARETKKLLNIVVPPRTASTEIRCLAQPLDGHEGIMPDTSDLYMDIILFCDKLPQVEGNLLREVLFGERIPTESERACLDRLLRDLRRWLVLQGYFVKPRLGK